LCLPQYGDALHGKRFHHGIPPVSVAGKFEVIFNSTLIQLTAT
jgi:hypothetical protein